MKQSIQYGITLLFGIMLLCTQAVWAQGLIIGTVSDENGSPLPGATVVVEETNTGTTTDFDGNYQISADIGQTLVFSYVGYVTQKITISTDTVDIALDPAGQLDEVVITALGISRDKKSLGYAVQTVDGESFDDVRSVNPIESLQGEVAGLDVQSFNSMGGSANVVIRGYSSFTGSNQALFVIDGTPIDNETGNSRNTETGRGGVDFGNASGTDKEKIAKQFWIAMYNRGFEGWTVYRLYDAPTLQNSGTINLPVLKRYTYPQSEQTINGDNVKAANGDNDTQQTSIFWDTQ